MGSLSSEIIGDGARSIGLCNANDGKDFVFAFRPPLLSIHQLPPD
jgi:hypothetical protein